MPTIKRNRNVIGIDARKLVNNKAGIGNYTYNLIKEVIKIDKANQYILYTADEFYNENITSDNCSIKCLPIKYKSKLIRKLMSPFWQNISLRRKMNKDGVNIFFSPNFFKPLFFQKPTILTIHDLTFYTVPQAFSFTQRVYNKLLLWFSLKGKVEILTVSDHSKRDIISYYSLEPEKVHITNCAVDKEYFKPLEMLDKEKSDYVVNKYSLPNNYVLFVGTIEPRKNIKTLIDTFININKNTVDDELTLVICGSKGIDYNNVVNYIEKTKMGQWIRLTGFVDEEDLPYIYANADLFVYPSLYEGFGMPALEAMASGVPVITSDRSSLPEVVGDAAICLDPNNKDLLAENIQRFLNDKSLRVSYIERGLRQVNKFQWNHSADVFLKVVNKLTS